MESQSREIMGGESGGDKSKKPETESERIKLAPCFDHNASKDIKVLTLCFIFRLPTREPLFSGR